MSSIDCRLSSNPDVSGAGVRIAVYGQGIVCFILPLWSLLDLEVSPSELLSAKTHATTNLILAFTILISCFVQALTRGLSNYHTVIILSLSWMNNTNAFIFFLLYVQRVGQDSTGVFDHSLLRAWRRRAVIRAVSFFICLKDGRFSEAVICIKDWKGRRGSRRTLDRVLDDQKAARNVNDLPRNEEATGALLILSLGSLHFTVMSALGLWLWSGPQSFGSTDAANCAVRAARISVLGFPVPFGSQALRVISLMIYSLFLLPGINLLLPVSLVLTVYDTYYKRLKPSLNAAQDDVEGPPSATDARTRRRSILAWAGMQTVLPVLVGLASLLVMNLILITDIEHTLRQNKHIQHPGEAEWGFGQTLAILVAAIPTLRDLVEAVSKRRRESDMIKMANRHLGEALEQRDANKIYYWIAEGADPTGHDHTHAAPLEVAVITGALPLAKFLVKSGADVGAPFQSGETALELAVRSAQWVLAEFLIQSGADVTALFTDNKTPFEYVMRCTNDSQVIWLFIESGADVNARFEEGVTPLEYSLANLQESKVMILIEAGADVREPFSNGEMPLEYALKRGQRAIALFFLELCVKSDIVNAPFSDGRTPLQYALAHMDDIPVRDLVRNGANVHAPFPDGQTPLQFAVEWGMLGAVKFLLKCGADVNARFIGGQTAVETAFHSNQYQMMYLLLTFGAEVDAPLLDGSTFLQTAIASGDRKLVEFLATETRVDLNAPFPDGRTTIETAIASRDIDMLELLLFSGADAAVPLPDGRTTLEIAILDSWWRAARLLLESSPKLHVNAPLSDGRTCLEVAMFSNEPFGVAVMVDHGADLDAPYSSGKTALEVAIFHGVWNAAQHLVELGADVNAPFRKRPNELKLRHDSDAVRFLLHLGADPYVKGEDGNSFFQLICGTEDATIPSGRASNNEDHGIRGSSGLVPAFGEDYKIIDILLGYAESGIEGKKSEPLSEETAQGDSEAEGASIS